MPATSGGWEAKRTGTPADPDPDTSGHHRRGRGAEDPKGRPANGKKDDKTEGKRRRDNDPEKPQKPESDEEDHTYVGDLADKFLPGSSKYTPKWAKPIVYDVKKKAVDPDQGEAFVAQDGTLVVHAVVDPKK
ncbi:hypothetical protein [Streptomyces sp. NPDC048650]|uniref:hypothetical protein n=1 Tax=unclassified Streptomyces TaxID=2593676 RepID=UPI00371D68F9